LNKSRCFVAVLLAATVTRAFAAEPASLPLAKAPFTERFDGNSPVPVSGNLIVGVSVGRPSGQFSPKNIRVGLSSRSRNGHLCLGVVSRDGRYAAENLYGIPEKLNGPASFEFRTRHLERISAYQADQVAVLIRDVPTCVSPEMGEILPNNFASDGGPLQMVIYLNAAPERVSVVLFKEGQQVNSESRCDGNRLAISIAFSATCTLTFPRPLTEGLYRLAVSMRERFEIVERSASVRFVLP